MFTLRFLIFWRPIITRYLTFLVFDASDWYIIKMKSVKFKNVEFRKRFKRAELTSTIDKFIYINLLKSSLQNRKVFSYILNSTKLKDKYHSKSKMKGLCSLSGRSKSIFKNINISRIKLREMISFGMLPGYKKAVW